LGRPIAAPPGQCAELLGVDLATVRRLAARVAPYDRPDGAPVWHLMLLERQLRPEALRRRHGGDIDPRPATAKDASPQLAPPLDPALPAITILAIPHAPSVGSTHRGMHQWREQGGR
jgi:hypothetical protein